MWLGTNENKNQLVYPLLIKHFVKQRVTSVYVFNWATHPGKLKIITKIHLCIRFHEVRNSFGNAKTRTKIHLCIRFRFDNSFGNIKMQRKAELGIGFQVSSSFEKRKNEREVCSFSNGQFHLGMLERKEKTLMYSFRLGNLFGAAYVWNVSRDPRPLFGLNFLQVPKMFEGFY